MFQVTTDVPVIVLANGVALFTFRAYPTEVIVQRFVGVPEYEPQMLAVPATPTEVGDGHVERTLMHFLVTALQSDAPLAAAQPSSDGSLALFPVALALSQ